MISFHSVYLAILILLNSTSFVHANHLSICEKFLIIIKMFCVNVAVDPPRYPTRILLPLSKICYERIRAFYYTLPWNTIVSQYLVGTSLRTTTSHYQDRHKVICICFSRRKLLEYFRTMIRQNSIFLIFVMQEMCLQRITERQRRFFKWTRQLQSMCTNSIANIQVNVFYVPIIPRKKFIVLLTFVQINNCLKLLFTFVDFVYICCIK